MWKTVDVRILLLVLLLLTNVKTTELSDQKKCGDPECETSIIRAQAIKDYTGPDCRYLNFKSGEEIMVYFKLSSKREDLWAGSKGKNFGYFPMDAVQIEEVFVTEEVEVPTKETDFLCLDGGEYVFENKDSIFNTEDEENEYMPFYTNEDYSKSNRDEALEVTGTSFPKEYKEPDNDNSKSKDQHILETTRHRDPELRGSKTGVDESIQQDQKSQSTKLDPKQATWSVSGIAGWLGLVGKQKEELGREISKTAEQITFRRRKIAITDDSDLKKLNDDSETEPRTWFQSALTDLMHFGSEKAGFSLLYKENYPDVQDISRITGDADHHGSTTASDTQEEEPRDHIVSKSNWFDLDIGDVLTFGYSNENEVKRGKYELTEATNPNEESQPSNIYSTEMLIDQSLRKQTSESPHHEVQEKYVQEITEVKKTDSKVQLANDLTEFKEATDTSVSTEPSDKLLKSHYAEHSSESDSEVMENLNIKTIIKESGRKNDQSGWYESIYSSIFGFSRIKSDNQPAHDSVSIQRSQELVIDQSLSSQCADQSFIPKDSPAAREENSGSPQTLQSFFSFSPFTNTLNAEGFASKEKGNVQITALNSRDKSSQSKKEGKVIHIKKESKAQVVGNQKVTEKVSVILDVATSQGNVVLSSLATKNHEEGREKTQDDELVKDNTSPFQSVRFRLDQGICYSNHIQITTYGKPENLEIQDNSSIENYSPILEDKQCSSLGLENIDDSLIQWKYTDDMIYSHEKFAPAIEEHDDGIAVRSKDKTERVDHSHLPATDIYLERLSKGEMTETIQDKEGSNQATGRELTFKELKEHTDHFPQIKDNPREDEVLHDVPDDYKLDMQQSKEQMLSAKSEITEYTEVMEIARHSDDMKSQKKCNDFPPNDSIDVNKNIFHNQNEEGIVVSQGTQNPAKFPSSSRACERKDLTDDPHSEEKTSKCDELQNFLSFNGYKNLLSFQSSTEKDKDSLQRNQENISSSDEISQSKNSPKFRNKEMEKKEQSHHKKYNLAMKEEGISNKDILLSSLATQNKASETTNLLKDKLPVSSAQHPSEVIMESLFSNQKLKGTSTVDTEIEQFPNNELHLLEEQHEAPTLTFSVQTLLQDYKVTNEEPTSGIQDVNKKEEMQKNFVSKALERDYIDVMKRDQVSDSVSFLQTQSEKHVVDSYDGNESLDLKSKEKLCLDHAKGYFPTNSDYNDNLIKSVVSNESINQFSQERIKEQGQISQCISELSESKQGDNMQDTEDELKTLTNKIHPNILNNQELSPEATSKEILFKSEKDIPGNGGYVSKGVFNIRVQNSGIQVPHKWTAGKHGEEEHSSKPIQEKFDHAKVSDASLTVKAADDHGLKEKLILSYHSSGTFSSKMPVSLPYLKEDKKDLKVEQEVLSSHAELSGCENSYILSQRPAEKCTCHMIHNARQHFPQTPDLDVLELGVSTGHKQLNKILNMQSQTFHTGHNDDLRLQSVDHPMDHAPLHTKHCLDMSHLTINLNDENFAQDRLILLPKTLDYIEQFADSGGSQEKSKKITESEKDIVLKNIEGSNDKTGKGGVVGNIFTKTSWFLGRLFQNKHNEDSQINEKRADNIVTQWQEVEILGRDSEQDKDEVQNTKAISYSTDNFKIMEQGTQEEIRKHTQEKSITLDSRDDSQKDNIFLIHETVSVVQETVKNYKLISDKELELEKASSLSGFQEHYINLVQELKRILQATMCESYELLLLEQEFENLCHDITTFPCEEVFSKRKQVIASVEYENTYMTEHKKCLNKKMNLVAELQNLMLDVRNKCEAQQANSGTTNTGQLSGSVPTVNSDKKLNSGQHLKTNKIPSVNIEHKMCASENSGQLNLKESVLVKNPMTQNSTLRYAEREWLFPIILYLSDISDFIKSAFSFMMFMSEKQEHQPKGECAPAEGMCVPLRKLSLPIIQLRLKDEEEKQLPGWEWGKEPRQCRQATKAASSGRLATLLS
ncbi:UNVERIFIED_CONTAM: hypothetical protein K2H54_039785 [Gekko kuhli]